MFNRFELLLKSFPLWLFAVVLSLPVIPSVSHADEEEVDLLDIARRSRKTDMELYYSALVGSVDWDDKKTILEAAPPYSLPARDIELPYGKLSLAGGIFVALNPEPVEPDKIPEGMEIPDPQSICGIYIGDGRFSFTPANDSERWSMNFQISQLHPAKKYSDLDAIDVALDGGFVACFEGKWKEPFVEGREAVEITKKQMDAAKRLWQSRGGLVRGDIARLNTWDVFEGRTRDGLILDLKQKDLKGIPAFYYVLDPLDTDGEAVQLWVRKRYALNRDVVTNSLLSSWFLPEIAEGKTDRELGYARLKLPYDVSHYDMDMTVYKNEDVGYWGMRVDGTLDVKVSEKTNLLRFAMMNFGENEFDPGRSPDEERLSGSNRVIFSEVTDSDGEQLQFMHNGHTLTVKLPRAYEVGEELKLGFRYEGLFITTIKQAAPVSSLTDSNTGFAGFNNYRVPNDYPWFPQSASHKDSFTFDWTLKLPKPMVAATSGTLLSLEEVGKYNVHTITESTPVTFPAILFGRFMMRSNTPDRDKGEYPIRIFVHPGYEKDAGTFLDDAQAVIKYFESLFGPYPFGELDIAQMPTGVGYAQAPAGLIQMDGFTFLSKTDAVNLYNADERTLDIRDNFVPHEIAHEWWGHKAGWGSSRDQWVSETFAEYAAALFIEERERQKSGDPEDMSGYEHRKRRWGLEGRLGHTYDRTGPLWVGNRTGRRRTSTLYARGPLVLDMLRQNFGKEKVVQMMYTWCELATRNDGKVVTEDLQGVLEKVLPGVGFDEFMKMYIKGNEPLPDDPKLEKAGKLGKAKY